MSVDITVGLFANQNSQWCWTHAPYGTGDVEIGLFTNTWLELFNGKGEARDIGLLPNMQTPLLWGQGPVAQVGLFSHDSIPGARPGLAADGWLSSENNALTSSGFPGKVAYGGPLKAISSISATPDRFVWWQQPQPASSLVAYTCVLSGSADGLEDLVLPLSSYQTSLETGDGSRVQAVIPDVETYEQPILDRRNGDITIHREQRYTDGSSRSALMVRAGNLKITTDKGARRSSITIRADELLAFSEKSLGGQVDQVVSRRLRPDGTLMFQIEPIPALSPGDHIFIEGVEYKVDRASTFVGTKVHQMNITVSMV